MTTTETARDTWTPYRFTREVYHRLGELGVLDDDVRTELIDGVIYAMAPESPEHAYIATNVHHALRALEGPDVQIRIASSLVVGEHELVPDAMALRRRADGYRHALPTAADALLVVEIARSTLPRDLGDKALLYGQAAIPEYWVVDVVTGEVRVLTDPRADGYRRVRTYRLGEAIPVGFAGRDVSVVDLIGPAA